MYLTCMINNIPYWPEDNVFALGNTSEKTQLSYIKGLDFDMSIIHPQQ